MKINAQILSVRMDVLDGKRGRIKQTILCCLDLDSTHPLLNTFDYVATDEDAVKFGPKVTGKRMEFGAIDFTPIFGGRLRARGVILNIK